MILNAAQIQMHQQQSSNNIVYNNVTLTEPLCCMMATFTFDTLKLRLWEYL